MTRRLSKCLQLRWRPRTAVNTPQSYELVTSASLRAKVKLASCRLPSMSTSVLLSSVRSDNSDISRYGADSRSRGYPLLQQADSHASIWSEQACTEKAMLTLPRPCSCITPVTIRVRNTQSRVRDMLPCAVSACACIAASIDQVTGPDHLHR